MNHQLTQPTLDIPSHVTVKRGADYQKGDSVTITEAGTRNQTTAYVTEVITERVFEAYAIALLSPTRLVIEDVPGTVGGGTGSRSNFGGGLPE